MEARETTRSGCETIQNQIVQECKQHPEIAAVFLFGSYGTCYQTKFSDIDLGVLFSPDCVPDLKGEMRLAGSFCKATGRDDVDLVVLNKAPLPLRYRIVVEGQLIYEQDYVCTSDFLATTYTLFLDYNIDYRRFMDEYRQSLKEAYTNNG